MRSFALALVVVALALLAPSEAAAAEPVASGFFSSIQAVRVSGDRAYAAVPAGLVVYDVSDPSNPRELSHLFLDRSGSFKLEVSGDYVFVLSGAIVFEETLLRVVDVSDPAAPHVVAEYTDLADSRVQGMLVTGTTLALANGNAVELVDISDPTSPTRAASLVIAEEPEQIVGLATSGSTLYATWIGLGGERPFGAVTAIDISNPLAPAALDELSLPMDASPYSVATAGDAVYVGVTPPATVVLDATDPSALAVAQTISYTFTPNAEVFARGDRLFVGTEVGDSQAVAVKVYDVSTPLAPELLGETETACKVIGMDYDPGRSDVFMPCSGATGTGMTIAGVTPAGAIAPLSTTLVPRVNDVEVSGATTFLAATDGLYAVRPAAGGGVDVLGRLALGPSALHVQVSGARAYVYAADNVIGTNARLHVVDVADPANMRLLGTKPLEGAGYLVTSNRFYVDGETLYVATPGGLEVYDASDPAGLELLGTYATPDLAENVIAANGLAYLTTLRVEDGIQKVDLYVLKMKNPARPKLKGRLRGVDNATYGNDLALQDGRLYLAVAGPGLPFPHAGDGRFVVVDVRKPAKPRVRAKIYTTPDFDGYSNEIALVGDLAYVADGLDGITVISIADDRAPAYVRSIDTPGFTVGIWVDATGNVSVADQSSVQVYAP
jgi:hypothetical protein